MRSIIQRFRPKDRSVSSSTSEKENDQPVLSHSQSQPQPPPPADKPTARPLKPARRFSKQEVTNKDDPQARPKSGGFAEMWTGTISRAQGKESRSSKLVDPNDGHLVTPTTTSTHESQRISPISLETPFNPTRPTTPFSIEPIQPKDIPSTSPHSEFISAPPELPDDDDYTQMIQATAHQDTYGSPPQPASGPVKRVAFISPVRTPTTSIALDSIAWDKVDLDPSTSATGSASVEQGGEGKAESSRTAMMRAKNVFRSRDKLRTESDATASEHAGGTSLVSGNHVGSNHSSNKLRIVKKGSAPPTMIHPPTSSTSNSTSTKPRFPSRLSHRRADTAESIPPSSTSTSTSTSTPTSPSLKSPSSITSSRSTSLAQQRSRPRPAPVDSIGLRSGRYCDVRQSWSEITEDDLVSNLSPRERTRQEVLWEIVSSEDRYVTELCRLKSTFVDALLPPSNDEPPVIPSFSSPLGSPRSDSVPSLHSYMINGLHRSKSPSYSSTNSPPSLAGTNNEDYENLPIAARFASPTMMTHSMLGSARDFSGGSVSSSRQRGGSMDTTNTVVSDQSHSDRGAALEAAEANDETIRVKPNGKYSALSNGRPSDQDPRVMSAGKQNFRSHQSLPPPPKGLGNGLSNMIHHSFSNKHSRFSLKPAGKDVEGDVLASNTDPSSIKSNKLYKHRQRMPSASSALDSLGETSPPEIPEDLKIILEVLSQGVLDGHLNLATQLRKRYDDQYPLVRSLTDIFIANSSILNQYNAYVLHLEKALQQVESAILAAEAASKRSEKGLVPEEGLEEIAADLGETGLIISLSKPFQRLLKYPLLFQNLLFHTDATSHEYDGTMLILEQVDSIVRRIEDEKSSQEQREKTRDAIARIDGLDNDRLLAVPKPSRVHVREHKYAPASPIPSSPSRNSVRRKSRDDNPQRRSLKRLSDLMRGEEKETWVVVFSDVSLLCQKVGTTSLPIGHHSPKQETDGKGRYNTIGRRSRQILPRNMYKFVKVLEWHVTSDAIFSNGMTDMQDISHSREASFGLSPTASRTEPSGHHVSITEHDEPESNDEQINELASEQRHDNNYDRHNYYDDQGHTTHERDEQQRQNHNEGEQGIAEDTDSDDSEGAMSLIFGSSTKPIRPTSMDGAVGSTTRRPRREGRFSMGPIPREDDDVTGTNASVPCVRKALPATPAISPSKKTLKKVGSGGNGATTERSGTPSGSLRGASTRPTSRISTRSRGGAATPSISGTTRPRPTNLSMNMNTDRQQAKFAGRLRFPQGHAPETSVGSSVRAGTAKPAGTRAGQTVGRDERLEKGKALVLPKAPGGRI